VVRRLASQPGNGFAGRCRLSARSKIPPSIIGAPQSTLKFFTSRNILTYPKTIKKIIKIKINRHQKSENYDICAYFDNNHAIKLRFSGDAEQICASDRFVFERQATVNAENCN